MQSIPQSIPEEKLIKYLPVMYSLLYPIRIPTFEQLEILSRDTVMIVECAILALDCISGPYTPLEAGGDLWPRVWAWVQSFHTFRDHLSGINLQSDQDLYVDFMVFASNMRSGGLTGNLIREFPGFLVILFRAWEARERGLIAVVVFIGDKSSVPLSSDEIREGAGGTVVEGRIHGLYPVLASMGLIKTLTVAIASISYTELPDSTYTLDMALTFLAGALSQVEELVASPSFQRSPLFERWAIFANVTTERLEVMREFDSVDFVSQRACDYPKCRIISEKINFKRCAGCESLLYCSKECQTLDWRQVPPVNVVHEAADVHDHSTPRERAFMRKLLHNDYGEEARGNIYRDYAIINYTTPGTACFTLFDYTSGTVKVENRPLSVARVKMRIDPEYWEDEVARAANSEGRRDLHVMLNMASSMRYLPHSTIDWSLATASSDDGDSFDSEGHTYVFGTPPRAGTTRERSAMMDILFVGHFLEVVWSAAALSFWTFLLLALLPFGSFISASPLSHPGPEPRAEVNRLSTHKPASGTSVDSGEAGSPGFVAESRDAGARTNLISHLAGGPAIVVSPVVPSREAPDDSLRAKAIITSVGSPKLKSTPESGVGGEGTGRRGLSMTADTWDVGNVITPAVPSRETPAESLRSRAFVPSTGVPKLEPSPQGGVDSGGTGRRDFTTYDSGDPYTNEPRDSAQKNGGITFLSPDSVPPSRHVVCCDIASGGAAEDSVTYSSLG
ncbi:hypothetical protein B0H19DRAFT_1352462 [Mycena capillaripes]|nr:hypothetical protein B0H19DRAFT_1352462 [Mycena capillaripes]